MPEAPQVAVQPELILLYNSVIHVGVPLEVGSSRYGRRRIVPITGGYFSGPRLRGTIVEGGADWQFVRQDGVMEIEARYTLKTDDGEFIYLANRGVRAASPEVAQQLLEGEEVSPSSYYFRSVPHFESGAGRYAWLNSIVAIGVGERRPDEVLISVYAVT